MVFFVDFLALLTVIVGILLMLFIVTQMAFPMISGEPLFPIFRKSVIKEEIIKAEHKLETVAETEHLKRVVDEINRREAKLEKKE